MNGVRLNIVVMLIYRLPGLCRTPNCTVLNRAVSRTYCNMAPIFSLFTSVDNVSLPKMKSCTVVTAGDNSIYLHISISELLFPELK